MKRLITLISLCMLTIVVLHAQKPRQVIMYIGDGFGVAPKTAARMALGQGTDGKRFSTDPNFQILALDKLKYNTMVTTHSKNSWITDSGPGATVYAAGQKGKVDNESIAFDVQSGTAVQTVLEAAKKAGYAVGLVTTTRVTHATPASFASHTWFRDLEDYIAAQFISSTQAQYEAIYNDATSKIKPYDATRDWKLPDPKVGVEVDVILGGGSRHFFPNAFPDTIVDKAGKAILNAGKVVTQGGRRTDGVNLVTLAKGRGYTYVNSRDALLNLDVTQFAGTSGKKLLGLFHPSHVNYEQDRQLSAQWEPSLSEMTELAIKVLKAKSPKGFFLIVEGGRIDHLEHANSGGITVVSDGTTSTYTVDADRQSYVGGGEAVYGATATTARQDSIYGSDYLIKEVLAFNYAVEQGRKLLADNTAETLIFSSSDHECGGTAIVALHDEGDLQANGTKVRTYASGPRQNNLQAASSGAATASAIASPINVKRGDVDFASNSPAGWFPNYSTYTFQGRPELWPQVSKTGRRIVVSYGSNPITNGNGVKPGGTPGNHTPQDVWVGGDDNVSGTFASRITGRGLLDNTDLTPIMIDFLKVTLTSVQEVDPAVEFQFKLSPNPVSNDQSVKVSFKLDESGRVQSDLFTFDGRHIQSLINSVQGQGEFTQDINTAGLPAGVYIVTIKVGNKVGAQKLIVQ